MTSIKVEAQFHGNSEALRRLRDLLAEVGVYVHVDHEFSDMVWPGNRMMSAGLMVPVPDGAAVEHGAV